MMRGTRPIAVVFAGREDTTYTLASHQEITQNAQCVILYAPDPAASKQLYYPAT